MTSWRRLFVLLALGALGTLAALSISTSLALFSATGPQQVNSFTTGTVSLESCGSSSSTCIPLSGSAPITCSLTSNQFCYYTLEYTGTLDAWIGLYVVPSGTCSPMASYTYTTTSTVTIHNKTTTITSPHTVVLSSTLARGQTGAIPDLLGDAIPASPPPTYVFEIRRGQGSRSCSVTLSGQAVQVAHNSSGIPHYPYNPLSLTSGPVAWS
ncbi:MAG: hypothetical protein WA751_00015 [Candidatus Dormiibacterota bacterium]